MTKDHGISPPATSLPANWMSSVALGGMALMGILPLFLNNYLKGRKMTKLEKACVAIVIAFGEKVQELEERNETLTKELGESLSKKQREALEKQFNDLERAFVEMRERAERAEAKLAATPAAAPAPAHTKRKS